MRQNMYTTKEFMYVKENIDRKKYSKNTWNKLRLKRVTTTTDATDAIYLHIENIM
jgi:hypothetical protein